MAGINQKYQNKIEDLEYLKNMEKEKEIYRGKASPVPIVFFVFLLFVLVKSCVL